MSGRENTDGGELALRGAPEADMPLPELLEAAQRMAFELARRAARPDFVDALASVGEAGREQERPTLTGVQGGLERLARTVDAARTAVAGHTDRVFESPRDRSRLLGLPPGKTGFRSSADFLEQTLHIPRRDARNRVARAQQHLGAADEGDTRGTAETTPRVSGALWNGSIDPAAADLVTRTLNEARAAGRRIGAPSSVVDELVTAGEEWLMTQALQVSPTTLSAICRRWRQRFDAALRAHGPDPDHQSTAEARALVYRGRERGLHQWLLNLTDDQHEILKTVASAGSNPRAGSPGSPESSGAAEGGTTAEGNAVVSAGAASGAGTSPADAGGMSAGQSVGETQEIPLRDPRRRAQREVDAVISALQAALAVATNDDLSATGGSRPQVLVTIDVETLTDALLNDPDPPPPPPSPMTSSAAFTGPIDPRIIRTWACDADLIPVVLGGEGQVLDVGRAQRLFPLRLRRAITARDQGCATPGCSIPAPWCDVHHVNYWENGGPTSVDNGVLLCQHHHQAVHHGQWRIEVRNGVPWFQDTGPRLPTREPSASRLARNAHWHDAA